MGVGRKLAVAAGAVDDGIELSLELGKIEVGVRIGEHVATSAPRRRPR